jgi:hypothetical protein
MNNNVNWNLVGFNVVFINLMKRLFILNEMLVVFSEYIYICFNIIIIMIMINTIFIFQIW